MLYLNDIVLALTEKSIPLPDVKIGGVVIDSRLAEHNSLFVALPGENTDGHNFLHKAFENGAVLALIHQDVPEDLNSLDLRKGFFTAKQINPDFPLCLRVENTLDALQRLAAYWREKHPVRTIGITGSVGKTTTKELTASLLSQKYKVLKNPGNRNNEIGLPLTLLELETSHEYAVLEMGFYVPGEIMTLCNIAKPQVGVVTNIGKVHASRAGSQAMIAKGKTELVESLPPGPQGIAILNMDDPWVKNMASKTSAEILSYGITQNADLMAENIVSHGLKGLSLNLKYRGKRHQVHSPLLGEFSAYTILRAAAVALTEGLDWESINTGIANSNIDLRMRQIPLANGATILDDTYNASPASTIAALNLLSKLEGRKVAFLGDMLELGPYEMTGHQEVGAFAAEIADVLILVGQRFKKIAESALENRFPKMKLRWYSSAKEAASSEANTIRKGDVVLIKGSNSMHMNQIITALEEQS